MTFSQAFQAVLVAAALAAAGGALEVLPKVVPDDKAAAIAGICTAIAAALPSLFKRKVTS